MGKRRYIGSALLLAMTATACAAGGARTEGSIPVEHVAGSRMPEAALNGRLFMPGGAGPFPAVILLHGCGGPSRLQDDWAERLVGWGYAALALDSFSARGTRTVCAPARQHNVTPQDRVGDVKFLAHWLGPAS